MLLLRSGAIILLLVRKLNPQEFFSRISILLQCNVPEGSVERMEDALRIIHAKVATGAGTGTNIGPVTATADGDTAIAKMEEENKSVAVDENAERERDTGEGERTGCVGGNGGSGGTGADTTSVGADVHAPVTDGACTPISTPSAPVHVITQPAEASKEVSSNGVPSTHGAIPPACENVTFMIADVTSTPESDCDRDLFSHDSTILPSESTHPLHESMSMKMG